MITIIKITLFNSKINPADCVDMDCDAMKKVLIEDLDGTLVGASGGSVIPESEFEWDVNPVRCTPLPPPPLFLLLLLISSPYHHPLPLSY